MILKHCGFSLLSDEIFATTFDLEATESFILEKAAQESFDEALEQNYC